MNFLLNDYILILFVENYTKMIVFIRKLDTKPIFINNICIIVFYNYESIFILKK